MTTFAQRLTAFSRKLDPYRQRWQALSTRDQRALLVMAACLIFFAAWTLVVTPILGHAQRQQDRYRAELENLAWMQANAAVAQQSARQASGALPPGQSLLAVINASAQAAGLSLQRFEPDGETRVRVTLEKAVFTDVMRWLVSLEQQYGIVTGSLTADSPGEPGLVNIRLTLGQGG